MGDAGYSGTPLSRKLGIKEGHLVALVDAPPGFSRLLAHLPPDVRTVEGLPDDEPPDVVLLFATEAPGLESSFRAAARRLHPDGGLWVGWPKKSSSLESDLDKMGVRRIGLDGGLVDNKVCAIDEDWSGLRFVYRLEDRPGRR
ncbi:MAG TPA: hypothetical protein VLL48_08215 [Longimicrobiales bacterium]|nr:hypothetical protein [Longimicrobiales bacterium]